MQRLAFYLDEGISEALREDTLPILNKALKNKAEVVSCDSENILKDEILPSIDALLITGGRGTPYIQRLGDRGQQLIRKFVNDGGVYLGFSAGAYIASKQLEFAIGTSYEKIAEHNLKLFDGKAIGPVFNNNKFAYQSEEGAEAVSISGEITNNELVSVYFNGGCAFVEDVGSQQKIEVLATYEDHPKKSPAIIECQVGKGKAILSGIHPEYNIDRVRSAGREDVFKVLSDYSNKSFNLFVAILERALKK